MYGTYPLGSTSSADLTEPNQRGYVPYIPPGEAPHRQTPRNRIYRGMYRTYPSESSLQTRLNAQNKGGMYGTYPLLLELSIK
jgi:hypothetical protein